MTMVGAVVSIVEEKGVCACVFGGFKVVSSGCRRRQEGTRTRSAVRAAAAILGLRYKTAATKNRGGRVVLLGNGTSREQKML